MPSREAELPMNGAATLEGASTLTHETHAAVARRSLPSAALGLSPSVSSRPLVLVRVLRRTHTRGGGGIRLAVPPVIEREFARSKSFDSVFISQKPSTIYCPEGISRDE